MDPAQIIAILSALTAAVWSVWTWREDQQKGRQLKRDQEAALFVNSFILATEELQSRLYGMLEDDELAFYRKEYPGRYEFGSPAAIEILYRLSQYYGWAYRIYRYGPYTKDPRVIELTREIGKAWESRAFPGDAFRFSIDERISLGNAVVRRVGEVTAILPVFESIPLFQFEEEISDKLSKHAPLYQSMAVRSALEAIDRADQAEALEGHERLAVLQNLFVDLLAYLESVEGFHVSLVERRKARLKGAYAQASPAPAATARILHQTRGRVRLRVPRLKTDGSYANRLQSLLQSMENIRSIRINISAASVIICYGPEIPDEEFARRAVRTIEEGCCEAPQVQ
jgi:hypothetical protein